VSVITLRELRRSKRNKKATRLLDSGSETETEVPIGWDLGNLLGDKESEQEGSESSFGDFSSAAHCNYKFEAEKVDRIPTVVEEEKEFNSEKVETETTMSKESTDSGRGATPEPSLGEFFRFYMDDQRRREEESRRNMETQQKMIQAMMARTEVRDEPPPAPAVTLPCLKEGGEVEEFLTAFETALKVGEVPREHWKRRLVSNLPVPTLVRINGSLTMEDASYAEVVDALRGGSSVTFCSAAEDMSTGEIQ